MLLLDSFMKGHNFMYNILSVVSYSGVGKTTLIEGIIKELNKKGIVLELLNIPVMILIWMRKERYL